MMVHEASLQFRVVREGPIEALDSSAKIAEYIRDAGQTIGIPLLDHVILGDAYSEPYSFNEAGLV